MAPNGRLSQFKNNGKDVENGRLRRKEDVIELRKSRRDEQLSKRRNVNLEDEQDDFDEGENNNPMSPAKDGIQQSIQDIEVLVNGEFTVS